MKNQIRAIFSDESGSIAVIVALSVTLLAIFSAFVLDFGLAYTKASDVQNAADAASLAAAQMLPVDESDEAKIAEIKNTAVLYAEKNNMTDLSSGDVELGNLIDGKFTSVKVNIPSVVELSFAKTFGINSFALSRSAKARVSPCTKIVGAVPLGVDRTQLLSAIESNNTEHIYLKYGAGDGTTGSYGAIDIDGVMGGGASDFRTWLNYGYEGTIEIGEDLLPVEKGNMSGPTAVSVYERYHACTHYQDQGGCTADHYVLGCPRILKVLVIEKVGSSYVKVTGFAAFALESDGTDDEVLGSYVKYFEPGNASSDESLFFSDFGVYNVGLCE